MTTHSILEQRRIEAAIIKPIYEEMASHLGVEKAREILGEAIKKAAIEAGKFYAEQVDGEADLNSFVELFEQWKRDDALHVDVLAQSDDRFDFNVVRCRYSEMYREMGLQEIGDLLSCHRDGTFCTGYNPNIKFSRTQTIMKGASHCNFRYWVDESGDGEDA